MTKKVFQKDEVYQEKLRLWGSKSGHLFVTSCIRKKLCILFGHKNLEAFHNRVLLGSLFHEPALGFSLKSMIFYKTKFLGTNHRQFILNRESKLAFKSPKDYPVFFYKEACKCLHRGTINTTVCCDQSLIKAHEKGRAYSAFANSYPLQTDPFLFPFLHSHNALLSSNKFH